MPDSSPQTCPECGARVAADANQCDLCGAELASTAQHAADAPDAQPAAEQANAPGVRPVEAALPRGQASEADSAPHTDGEASEGSSNAATQLGLIIGIAAMLVVALFFITNLSKDLSAPVTPVPVDNENALTERPGAVGEDPDTDRPSIFERLAADESDLPVGVASTVDSLDRVIDTTDGEAAQQARRQKVDLLIGVGRMDHAAVTQRALALEEGSPEAWRRTGDLFYEWMGRMTEGPERVEVAEASIAAYERVLAETPDNLDVRADLATALLETNEPMQGVEEIQRVLDADPDHLQARFNYGIMLAMIGRTDASIEQFEHAQRIVGEGSPFYRQAEQIIAELRENEGQPMPGGERLRGDGFD